MMDDFGAGTWHRVLNGGYAYEAPTPCVILGLTRCRVKVAVLRKDGSGVATAFVTHARMGPPLPQGEQIVSEIRRHLAALAEEEKR